MQKNTLKDVQEIKRRLTTLWDNIDETVIFELLQSFGPDYEVERVINMITGNWDSCFQDVTEEEEVSILNSKCKTQHNIEKNSKSESTRHSPVDEISDTSSDYDDDDGGDDYYASTNLDDISVVDTVTRSSPAPLELCDNASLPNHNNEAIAVLPEVEFLEENNNDPNNNLDSAQILQELQNNSPDIERIDSSVESLVEFTETWKRSESPKPGCSKDTHDVSYIPNKIRSKLHAEVEQINAILPRFKRSLIYKTLCHYHNAKNRIELTLWDLLPEKKPKVQISPKRKLLDDICSVECKKNVTTLTKNVTEDVHIDAKRHTTKKKIVNSNDNDTNQQELVATKTELNKLERPDNNVNNCYHIQILPNLILPKLSPENKEVQVIKDSISHKEEVHEKPNTTILRPPKLTFLSSTSVISEPPALRVIPILSPPKLKISNDNKQVLASPIIMLTPAEDRSQKVGQAKQNIDEYTSSDTSVNKKNKQASNNDIVQSHSSDDLVVDDVIISQDKELLIVKTRRAKLLENDVLHSSQSNCTKDIFLNAKKIDNGKSEITDNLMQKKGDINISQGVMPSTSAEVNAIEKLTNPYVQQFKQNYTALNQTKMLQVNKKPQETYNCLTTHEKSSTSVNTVVNKIIQDIVKETKEEPKDTTNNANDKEVTLSKKHFEIYYQLIQMFPGIDTAYIMQLCKNYIAENALFFNDTELLQNLVEHLLNHKQKQPCIEKIESTPAQDIFDVNEQYANLLGIFPEADPVYLRDITEQIYNDPDMMKQFVQSKLENPDYPTRQQYLTKKKITEQQKQYTTDFQIEQFLDIFPDPFSYFEDEKRQCQFDAHAVDFLKHHFNKIRVNTLINTYAQYGSNLTLTVKALEALTPNMKTKRHSQFMQTNNIPENIPLLQECAFISHKAELRKYLDELKEKEEKEFNKLKANNELLECQCCFDNECMPSKCSTCEDGHIFCNSCIAKCTDIKLANGETHIHCLLNCGNEIHLSVLQHVLRPTKFSILLQKRQEEEVMAAGLEGLVSCPFCHFASIPPQEDKIFKCFNPDCMKESCRLCKEMNHLPLKCSEVKTDAARLYLEEKMTEALVRKCHKCGRTFFKEEGCNKMTCPCGAQMCYVCDKPITSYHHFSGQGSTRSDLCPLWSDDRRMNAEAVIKVYKETMKQIKEKNPEVEINANALLPKLPPKTNGPHNDIPHADAILGRADRIARQFQ